MRLEAVSVKSIFYWIITGMILSMLVITVFLFFITGKYAVLAAGGILLVCAFLWMLFFTWILGKRLSLFTTGLCQTLDHMIAGDEILQNAEDNDSLFARISHRLDRLYRIMQESSRKVDKERKELQILISDISHQV